MGNLKRREVLLTTSVLVTNLFIINHTCGQESDTNTLNTEKIEKWMNEWMYNSRSPAGVLNLSRFSDRMYFLISPIQWVPNSNQENHYSPVTAPRGFVTDFASIPRIFWSILPPDGLYTYAAIIHDYLYWEQPTSREIADKIFNFAMEDFGVNSITRKTIYDSVSVFGETAWTQNRKLRASGESRYLKKFPNDPRVSWADWKKSKENFFN